MLFTIKDISLGVGISKMRKGKLGEPPVTLVNNQPFEQSATTLESPPLDDRHSGDSTDVFVTQPLLLRDMRAASPAWLIKTKA